MMLEKGNVVKNISMGRKFVIRESREMAINEEFVCDTPHEDGDVSYMCGSDYCRCSQ